MPAEPPAVAATRIALAGIGDEAGDALGDQLRAIDALGWSAIELRTIGGTAIADLDAAAFAAVVEALRARGTAVTAVASRIGGWARPISSDPEIDRAELAVLARRCAELGTRTVRVMSYANDGLDDDAWGRAAIARLRDLAERAEAAGLVLLHENCSGWAACDGERALRLVDAIDSPAFGLLFDTGNGVEHGYRAGALLAQVVERVDYVHVKDAVGGPGAATYTAPGDGQVEVAACLRMLLGAGRASTWSLEPHVALRPHDAAHAAAGDRLAGFVDCGAALERLVGDEVLPAVAGWRLQRGALVREAAA